MDLSTTYLGFRLSSPFIAGAGPLADDLGMVKKLEDSGASAIVLRSIFEEQIEQGLNYVMDGVLMWMYEDATSYFPRSGAFVFDTEKYLKHIQRVKSCTKIPIIASLNGTAPGDWLHYSTQIQEAGADALEINIYHVAADPHETATDVEQRVLDCLRLVKTYVSIPVAVKLSPYYSALANLVSRIDALGADGVVLFSRAYTPETTDHLSQDRSAILYSNSSDLTLRLRWLGLLHGHVRGSLSVSGGVHTASGAINSIMAGADAIQLVSALLQHGPDFLLRIRAEFCTWMESNSFNSVSQMHGQMSLKNCPEPASFERANYARVLQRWRC